jgi:hypothetical protein
MATWESMNAACFWLSCLDMQGMTAIAVEMYLYDVTEAQFARVQAAWSGLLARLFPHAAAA